jgi:hypothetical protein
MRPESSDPFRCLTPRWRPQAVPLAALMLDFLERPGCRRLAECVTDYLDFVSFAAMDERWPELRAPLYVRMLGPLCRQSEYPPGFTSWRECVDDDEEAFTNFRCGWLAVCLPARLHKEADIPTSPLPLPGCAYGTGTATALAMCVCVYFLGVGGAYQQETKRNVL